MTYYLKHLYQSKKIFVIAVLALLSNSNDASIFKENNYSPLEEDEAFKVSFFLNADHLEVFWEIAQDHYLYIEKISVLNGMQEKIEFSFSERQITKIKDLFFGETSIAENFFSLDIPYNESDDNSIEVIINYQGCKKDTYCYPVMSKKFP